MVAHSVSPHRHGCPRILQFQSEKHHHFRWTRCDSWSPLPSQRLRVRSKFSDLEYISSSCRAYRFPTDSCPGYYGFAFLSNAPNPVASSIVSQKPTSTPSQYSQCIANLVKPTSTPTPTAAVEAKSEPTGQYWVFNRPSDGQVPLYGSEELPKGTWNM